MNYNYLTKITIMDKFKQFIDAISIEKVDDFSYKVTPSENFFRWKYTSWWILDGNNA